VKARELVCSDGSQHPEAAQISDHKGIG
jgi:hypothetical protein